MHFLERPIFEKTCRVETAINPLTPISTVSKIGFQEEFLMISSMNGLYFDSFLILAARIPSSAGKVNSSKITFFKSCDQITMSGLSGVL